MKEILSHLITCFLVVFSSAYLFASDSEESPDQTQYELALRAFAFDQESLNKALLLTQHSHEQIIQEISEGAIGAYSLNHNQDLQELYNNNVNKAKNAASNVDAIGPKSVATFIALAFPSIKLQEDFDHGLMIEGHYACIFVKLIFPIIRKT